MKYTQDIPWYKNDYLVYPFNKEESLHYIFNFQKNSLAEKNIKEIVKLKEEHHLKILSFLELDNNRKIDYYIYSSIQEKNLLIGDDSPGNAIWEELENNNPKKFEIHVVYNEKCRFIGEHEDTHLLSLPWGLSIYLFCEGLAQYMENTFLNRDLHSTAKELMEEGKIYSIDFICNNNNWEHVEPTIIYPQVGSFIKYLIEYYNKENFKRVYQNTSREKEITENLLEIEKIYQKNVNQLEKEWLLFLKNNNTIT
jgi:hypothetical protein